MSFKLIGRIMHEVELPRNKQLVLFGMAENADDDGKGSRPSVDRIAWKAGYKPRQVINIMRQLETDEIIVKVKEAAQHRPAEYDIHLKSAPGKMSFEEWRRQHGRYAGRAGSDAEVAPLERETGDSGMQSRNSGMQSRNSGMQSTDPRGAAIIAPEPSEPLHEPLNEPREKSELFSSQRRYKPSKDEHQKRVEAWFLSDPLAQELRQIIDRAAARNTSGEISWGRIWNGHIIKVESWRKSYPEEAIRYALEETNRREKADIRYTEGVLRNNPEGAPKAPTNGIRSPVQNGSGHSGVTRDSSKEKTEAAAKRKEGYEWLFDE